MKNFLLWLLLMATFITVGYLTSNIFWGFGSMFVMAYFIRHHVVPSQAYYYDYDYDNDDDFKIPLESITYNPSTGLMCIGGVGTSDVGGYSWGSSD
jgi:hypothetical protein